MHDVVVVGLDDMPALIAESVQTGMNDTEHREIAERIVQKLAPFNERLFLYEVSALFPTASVCSNLTVGSGIKRIDDPSRVLVVERGSLPRTKVRYYLYYRLEPSSRLMLYTTYRRREISGL